MSQRFEDTEPSYLVRQLVNALIEAKKFIEHNGNRPDEPVLAEIKEALKAAGAE